MQMLAYEVYNRSTGRPARGEKGIQDNAGKEKEIMENYMEINRKTKIVCTLGPSTDKKDVLRQLAISGMNVARLNFSHGSHAEQKKRLDQLKKVREELNLPIAALLDTKGPEIRLKNFKEGKVMLKRGQKFTLSVGDFDGDAQKAAITYEDLYKDVEPGTAILIDDGLIEMEVVKVSGTDITCLVKNGGPVSNHKGINVPDTELSMPFISEQDRADIEFGIAQDFDFIAASFTRSAEDILAIRKILDAHSCSTINIIAKIENKQGMDNIDEIIRVSDGIMIARGDMGVEIPMEQVPILQKQLIKKAYTAGKHVITATQMLDSMMKNPRPTRAEATDVATAVFDGTSAVMLSGETAAGDYPVEALQTMSKICVKIEESIDYNAQLKRRDETIEPDITNAIAHATCTTAMDLNAAAIVVVTSTGFTAKMVSKYRPGCRIVGCSFSMAACRRMSLTWGVSPLVAEIKDDFVELAEHAVDISTQRGILKPGELAVIAAGVPLGISGTTNMIKVQMAGNVLISGGGIGKGIVSGRLCVAQTPEDLAENFMDGDILVVEDTTNEMMEYIRRASGLILEDTSKHAHGIIVGLTLDLPVLTRAANATKILKTGAHVLMDVEKGTVSANDKQ